MRWSVAVVLAATALPGLAQEAVLETERQEVGDACNAVEFQPGFVRAVDVNSDALADALLDYAGVVCDGYEYGFCGSGGCTMSLYVQDAAGAYQRVGELQAYDMVFDRPEEASFVVIQDGGWCGLSGAESCFIRYRIEGSTLVEVGPDAAPGSGKIAS